MNNPIPAGRETPDSETLDEERGWAEALRPLHPGLIPSVALSERIAALAATADTDRVTGEKERRRYPRLQRQRRLILGLAAISVALGAFAAVAVVAPRVALANVLESVSENLRRAEGVHYRITFFQNGKETMFQEIWRRDNNWRLEAGRNGVRFVQIYAGGKLWFYNPAEKTASYQDDTGPSAFPQSIGAFQMFQAQAQQALGNRRAEDLGTVTRGGRRMQTVAAPSPVQQAPFTAPVPGRTRFTIDLDRMLPALTEQQVRLNGQWTTVVRAELDLEQGVEESRFAIHDKNVRTYDLNAYGAQVGKRFAQPLASKRFSNRTIAVRDVEVNRDGDLFILYTDGSTPNKNRQVYPDSIQDDRGTRYTGTAGAIEPFMYHQNPRNSRGIVVGGEVMQGICLVPKDPKITPLPAAAAPQTVTLVFAFYERQGKKTLAGRARFTVPVRRVQTLLPDYAADLDALMLSGGDEAQFKQVREDGRRTEYANARDWAGMIRSTDRAIAQGVTDVRTYLDRATAFEKSGKPQRAAQSLADARALDENGFYADQITQAEAELQRRR